MRKIKKEYWFVVIAGILFGTIVFGGKVFADLGLSLYQISVFPSIIAIAIYSIFLIFKKESRFRKGLLGILLLYGIVLTFITVAQFASVILGIPVAIVVLLLYTQPLWTLFFSIVFLKERATKRTILSCLIVILGMIILVSPFQGELIKNWLGIVIALIGGISLSGWVVIGSFLSKKGNNPVNTLFAGNIFMVIILLVLYPFVSGLIKDPSFVDFSFNINPINWLYILGFALFAVVISQLFYLEGVKKVPTIEAGIILLLEPVAGAILAAIFLSQPLTLSIIIGGFLILFANYLVLTKPELKAENAGSVSSI